MKSVVYLIFFILFFSCQKEKHLYPRIIVPKRDKVIEVNTKIMLESNSTVLNWNFINDTIAIDLFDTKVNAKREEFNFPMDTIFPKYDLKIIVDTGYVFYAKNFEYKYVHLYNNLNKNEAAWEHYFNQKKDFVDAIFVLIYNNSNNKAFIHHSYTQDLGMIQEALDDDGNWKPIEYKVFFSYNNHLQKILNSKHYLATSIIKYQGNFKTKLRVKLLSNNYVYYSNEFKGVINRSQFNQNPSFERLYQYRQKNEVDNNFNFYRNEIFLKSTL